MSKPQNEAPLLVKRFWEAHQSKEIPSFNWDNNVILHLSHTAADTQYQAYFFDENQINTLGASKTFFKSIYDETLKGKRNHFLNTAQIERDEISPVWKKLQPEYIQVIPLSLLSGPVGILLVPTILSDNASETAELYDYHLPLLGGLIRECLTDDLYSNILHNNGTLKDATVSLLRKYVQIVAKWIVPCEYIVKQVGAAKLILQETFCKAEQTASNDFCIMLPIGREKYEIIFRLPTLYYPLDKAPEWLHEIHHYTFRKHEYQLFLVTMFKIVLEHYELVEQYKVGPEKKLEEVERLLQEVRELINKQKVVPPPPGEGALPRFCFYEIKKNWTIRFDGKDIHFAVKSQKGMECIRQLIEQSGQHIPSNELHQILEIGGFNYSKKNKSTEEDQSDSDGYQSDSIIEDIDSYGTIDPKRDHLLIEEVKEELGALIKMEEEMQDHPEEEEKKYWKLRLGAVRFLIQSEPNSRFYKREFRYCVEKISALSVLDDENYGDPTSEIFQPILDKTKEKSIRDSIRKGIKAALNSLKEHPDIYNHLKETIIITKKSTYEPFMYVPDLSSNKMYQNIIWYTDPPK